MTQFTFLAAALAAFLVLPGEKSGRISGRIDVGPLSPVERPNEHRTPPPAFFRPLTVVVVQPGPQNSMRKSMMARHVATLKVSDHGTFSTSLPAGVYRLSIESSQKLMHVPEPQTVTVRAGKTTSVVFHLDTGIR